MNKKVLISGYIGFSNFGDDALLSVLVDYLKTKNSDITAFSSNPDETTKKFGIKSLYYKDLTSIFKGISSTDVLISGGGNLIQNETSTLSLFYYLFIIFLAKLMFKKVVLFSQGIGPVKGFFSTLFTKLILKTADLIIVRDVYSQRLLTKWGIHSKYSNDAVWSFETPEYNPQEIVGVQVRNYKYLHKDFYKFLAKYIDMFFSQYKIKIFSFQNSTDVKECFNLQKELRIRNSNIDSEIVYYNNPKQTAEEFSKLKYLIGMRLHANILGLKLGIKTLPISYSVKVRNLAYEYDIKFAEASEEPDLHPLLRDLTAETQDNPKIENAKKRKFEWGYLDNFFEKLR